jgi:hypothetical protein
MKAQMRIFLASVSLIAVSLRATAIAWADGTIRVSLIGESNEKMSVKLDVNSVKAGNVVFVVVNEEKKNPP